MNWFKRKAPSVSMSSQEKLAAAIEGFCNLKQELLSGPSKYFVNPSRNIAFMEVEGTYATFYKVNEECAELAQHYADEIANNGEFIAFAASSLEQVLDIGLSSAGGLITEDVFLNHQFGTTVSCGRKKNSDQEDFPNGPYHYLTQPIKIHQGQKLTLYSQTYLNILECLGYAFPTNHFEKAMLLLPNEIIRFAWSELTIDHTKEIDLHMKSMIRQAGNEETWSASAQELFTKALYRLAKMGHLAPEEMTKFNLTY